MDAEASSGATDAPVDIAKPTTFKNKNIRKRQRAASDEAEETTPAVSLQDLKEDQKLRAKPLGVDPTELLKTSAAKAAEVQAVKQKAAEKASAPQSGLSQTFSRTSVLETTEENPLLRAYIDSKLKEKHASKVARLHESDDASSSSKRQPGEIPSNEDLFKDDRWLYELPAHLRPVAPKERREADVAEGGMILGGTGIAEVALPDHFKTRMIADTAKATQELLRKKAANSASLVSQLSAGNFTANYDKTTS